MYHRFALQSSSK